MSAETKEAEISVSFEMNDYDFELTQDDKTFTAEWINKEQNAVNEAAGNAIVYAVSQQLTYEGDLKYAENAGVDYTKVATTVYVIHADGSSELVASYKGFDDKTIKADLLELVYSNGDEIYVVLEPMVDSYSVGDAYNAKNVPAGTKGDKVDDRKQTVVTIDVETWSDVKESGSGKFTTSYYVTDGKEATLVDLIEGLKAYDEYHRVGSGKDRKTYRLVYDINGDEVTAEWDVRPDKDEDRFGKVTSTPENPLDKDGDGVVTCDEYYGVTGLKWDDKKNACVTTSGNAVVTVPDTSAR